MPEPHSNILYGLDDRPPIGKTIMLALQHVLTMFGSTVAVPLMLGPIMGMDTAQIAVLISSVMLCSGVATLIQSTVGSRLPIIQGVSFSFLAAFFMIIAAVHPEGDDTVAAGAAMPYIAGAVMVGAVLEMIVGFSGAMGLIRRVLSPVVVGPVIMLIGLALYEAGAPVAATHWPIAIETIVLITVFSFVLAQKHPIFRMFPLLMAIVVSVATCGLLSAMGIFGPDHPARPNLDAFNQSAWFRTTGVFFPWGLPKFNTGYIVAVMAGYLASMIESFGDYHACKQMAGGGDPTPQEISRGIGCEGIGCALTGVFGGFSSTSYSENVGLIGLTKVGSRFVVQIGAVMLICWDCSANLVRWLQRSRHRSLVDFIARCLALFPQSESGNLPRLICPAIVICSSVASPCSWELACSIISKTVASRQLNWRSPVPSAAWSVRLAKPEWRLRRF